MPPFSQFAGAVDGKLTEFSFAEPYFENVGDAELLDSTITSLVQDPKGWLWVGTQHGLVRYDGYRFRKFVHDDNNPSSLPGDYVTALMSAQDGKLWVGTLSNGLAIFDPKTERFNHMGGGATDTVLRPGAAATSNVGGRIWAIIAEASGGVWVGANEGLDYWSAGNTHGIQHFRHDRAQADSLADDRVRSLLIDHEGSLWVGGASGLQRRKAGSGHFERIASDPDDPASLANQKIMTIFEAADGKLWLGTIASGAAWLDPGTYKLHWVVDQFKLDRTTHGWISKILEPQSGRIWLATFGGGIDVVQSSNGKLIQHIRHDATNASSLALNHIGAMLVDASGLLWAGTWGGGLQKFLPSNQSFYLLKHSAERNQGLSSPDVHSVLELRDGRILVGSDGNGIDIIDRYAGLVGGYRPFPGQPGKLHDGTITSLAQTQDGALWAGTQQAGTFRLELGSKQWQSYPTNSGMPDVINKFLVAKNGALWVGTAGGLSRWMPQQQRFEAAIRVGGASMNAAVYNLAEDAQGRIWAGSDAGLWAWDPDLRGLIGIFHENQRADSLASNLVQGLLVDHSGRLWVATADGMERLSSWDGKRATFEHISAMLGKPGKSFGENLVEDKMGRIWTDSCVIDPKTMHAVELGKADGYDIGSSWTGSFGSTHDGLILSGGTQGVAIIDTEKFSPWNFEPQVQASELTIDGKSFPLGLLDPTLILEPDQRNFSIGFAALDFSAPQKSRYSYFLKGYDAEWTHVNADHLSANYGNLWPGKYTLVVRASNRLGVWSSHELHIPILVLPAYWQTWWFGLLTLMSLMAAIWVGYRWRLQKVQRRSTETKRLLEKLVLDRTAELDEKNKQLEMLSVTDRLTGLYNRLKLDLTLEAEYGRYIRSGKVFSVILMDVDHFKTVNDTYGHQVGDMVLEAIAEILKAGVRDHDVIGRWGGEEFLVVCPDTDLAEALAVAERLRLGVATHHFAVVKNKTSSFGVATIRSKEMISSLVARADTALYCAKQNGRDRVEFER
ncbi:diguanylate cyclase [Undibacterium jejuense]|uniref:diguanylate cyclase n=1 Tax=Undibacterium jejuense TaxID=1344949 RepID=A0A923KIX0_9BURK|nr:diguanylate cyclase [Undibacterium jejuense]